MSWSNTYEEMGKIDEEILENNRKRFIKQFDGLSIEEKVDKIIEILALQKKL